MTDLGNVFFNEVSILLDPVLQNIINANRIALECDIPEVAPVLLDHGDIKTKYFYEEECSKYNNTKVAISTFDAGEFHVDGCYTKDPCSRYKNVKQSVNVTGTCSLI